MKGFKPTGHGPSSGFVFPSHMGFTGSTGNFTNVAPYTRRKFASGGYVRQESVEAGSPMVRRARATTALDEASGGRTPIRPGFKDGGKWIQGAIKHPGALHKSLGVPQGKKIPAAKLAKAAKSDNPTLRRRAILAKTLKKMHKQDGGEVKKPPVRGGGNYTFGQSLRAVPKLIGVIPSMITDALREKMSDTQRDVADTKRRRIDSIVDANYARGGAMKRMGYANGGRRDGMVGASSPPRTTTKPTPPMPKPPTSSGPAATIKEKFYQSGGLASLVARAVQARMAPQERMAPPPRMASRGPMMRNQMMRGPRPMMRKSGGSMKKCYADGGAAHADEAQDKPMMRKIAQQEIGRHVRYPAPKGHKGLGKMTQRR